MELGGRPQHYSICNITWDNNPARLEDSGSTLTLSTRPAPFFCSYLHRIGGIHELTERSDIQHLTSHFYWDFKGILKGRSFKERPDLAILLPASLVFSGECVFLCNGVP